MRASWLANPLFTLALGALVAGPVAAQDEEADAAPAAGDEVASGGGGAASDDADIAAEGESGQGDGESTGTGRTLAERISAVSNPVFKKSGRFELAPFVGTSVNDAFFRRWGVGTRASFHILESLSIDAGGAYNFWSEPLQAAVFLVPPDVGSPDDVNVQDEAQMLAHLDVGVTFSPFYGKVALMSEWIVHFDAFVSVGGGAILDLELDDAGGRNFAFHPALEVGAGGRLFLTRWLVLRADLRDYIYPGLSGGQQGVKNLLLTNFGVGIYVPFGFDSDEV
jgi:outer membrane beta-barrel protein